MSADDLKESAKKIAASLWYDYQNINQIADNLCKGLSREAPLRKYIDGPLPDHIKSTTGEIADQKNIRSNQIDLIVYDNQLLGDIFGVGTSIKVIPFELVYLCIEVKSFLSLKEFKNILEKIDSMRKLTPLKERRSLYDNSRLEEMAGSSPIHLKKPKKYIKNEFPFIIFSYDGVKPTTITKKWMRYLNKIPDSWWPRGIYILNQGCLRLIRPQKVSSDGKHVHTADKPIYDILTCNDKGDILFMFKETIVELYSSYKLDGFHISEYADTSSFYTKKVFTPKAQL